MDSNPIAKNFNRFLAAIASLRRALRLEDRNADEFISRTPAWDDPYDEPRITPYAPEGQRVRSESSLHLSC